MVVVVCVWWEEGDGVRDAGQKMGCTRKGYVRNLKSCFILTGNLFLVRNSATCLRSSSDATLGTTNYDTTERRGYRRL